MTDLLAAWAIVVISGLLLLIIALAEQFWPSQLEMIIAVLFPLLLISAVAIVIFSMYATIQGGS